MPNYASGIAIATVVRNDIRGFERTLNSIRLQSNRPAKHIVVDGSDDTDAGKIKNLATGMGSDYFWQPPQGVYSAMNFALSNLSGATHVLFLNAGDWLAAPDSLVRALREIQKLDNPIQSLLAFSWGIRQSAVIRLDTKTQNPSSRLMNRFGLVRFPHPSFFLNIDQLKAVDGFDTGFNLSADYAAALKIANPLELKIASQYFVSHHLDGDSSRRILRSLVEMSRARLQVFGWSQFFIEVIWGLPRILFSYLFDWANSFRRGQKMQHLAPNSGESISHFCEGSLEASGIMWPACCLRILEQGSTSCHSIAE